MSLFLVVALTTPVAAAPLPLQGTVDAPPSAHDLGSFQAEVSDLPVVVAELPSLAPFGLVPSMSVLCPTSTGVETVLVTLQSSDLTRRQRRTLQRDHAEGPVVQLIYKGAVTEAVEGRCSVMQQGGAVLTFDFVLAPGAPGRLGVPVLARVK